MTDPLDSEAAARILRRAHEIADDHADPATAESGVSPAALIDAAGEVGIDPDAVRDALALERFDESAPRHRRLDRLVGPTSIVVERVVSSGADETLAAIEGWLTTAYRMRCVADRDGTLECRPRPGVGASVGRTITSFSGDVNIRAVQRIVVDAEALHMGATPNDPRTLVRLLADRGEARARRVGGGSVAGLAGAGTAVAAVAGALPVLVVASAGLWTGGYLYARTGASHAEKVALELLRVLTAVDRGEQPAGLVGRATRRAGAAVRDTMTARSKRR